MKGVAKSSQTAAWLAWLVPGLGHVYQGRIGKGMLFLVCVLGSFLYGQYLGNWRVVYLKWDREQHRLLYAAQVCVGAAALPGLVQWLRVSSHREPILWGFQAPPDKRELNQLQERLGRWWELGTVYTMIAGLLNILVIYDAKFGPAYRDEMEHRGVSHHS